MNAFRQPVRGFPLRAALFACLLVCGCAHPRLPRMPDMSLAGIDTSALTDKVIVIDPGHGGPERGAIGARGLSEAEVNLTVALHLWGLLRQAGARPELTRSADQALYSGREFDLAGDLALRSQRADGGAVDLFVSVHHNASLDRSVNSLIVFYAMADPYRSRDAARAVGAALQARLGRERHSIQPGNYAVLRLTSVPAILGEASFISNKTNELDLAFARTLTAEARGYFDGILEFFSRGMPVVSELAPLVSPAAEAVPVIRACLDAGHAHAQVDSGSVVTTVNGTAVRHQGSGDGCVTFELPEMPNGRHRVCAAFGNTLGNSVRRCADVLVDLPPRSIAMRSGFTVIPPEPSSSTFIDALVLDRLGRPVIDGTPVAFSATAGTILRAEHCTAGGRARAVLASGSRTAAATVSVVSGDARAQLQIVFGAPQGAQLSLSVVDASGQPVAGAILTHANRILARSDTYGCIQVGTESGRGLFQLARQGYEPQEFTLEPAAGSMLKKTVVLEPVDAGIFLNRTVMLDPAGSDLSALPVLNILKEKIEHAGGRALLTWQAEPAPECRERVMRASRERADVFLCVSARRRGCSAGHYHRSEAGRELAHHLREAFHDEEFAGCRSCRVRHSTHDAVIQTSMTALEIEIPRGPVKKNPEGAAQAMYAALRSWLQADRP